MFAAACLLLGALPAGTRPTADLARTGATRAPFDELAGQARAAREAGRDAEAIAAYEGAVRQRPQWDEGLWWVGALSYQAGEHARARDAFTRYLELKPDSGHGYVMRGLSAFALEDWPAASRDLTYGLERGLGANTELARAARYSLGVALLQQGEFTLAIQPLALLARTTPASPAIHDAIGLTLLQMPMRPESVPQVKRDLVRRAGEAGYLDLGQKQEEAALAYAALVEAYPAAPGVHFAYGVFLLRTDSARGLAELRREVELDPKNVMAWLQIAFEQLVRGEPTEARDAAERAVALAPRLFAARNALGRALVELGETGRGIRELEEAAQLAPQSPEMHFALYRAYARAGRKDDAERARAVFVELEQAEREKKAASQSSPAPDVDRGRP